MDAERGGRARTHAGHCYVLNHDLPAGIAGWVRRLAVRTRTSVKWTPCVRQAALALFCGHDHKNAFVGHAHGIDLGYAPTCGSECYGPKSRYRGIRLFEFHESNPAGYVTRMLTWGDLGGPIPSNEVRVWFEGPLRDRCHQHA